MKHLLYNCLLLLAFALVACSKSSDESSLDDNALSPELSKVTAKEFRFYINPPKWAFKAMPSDVPGEGLVLTASNSAIIESPAVWYKKTGANKANIVVSFNEKITTVGYYYDFDLTFTDEHQGWFTGTAETTMFNLLTFQIETKRYQKSGYFTFDSDEDPDFQGIDADKGGNSINYDYFYGSWKVTTNNTDEYLSLYSDDTYLLVRSNSKEYSEERGIYIKDTTNDALVLISMGNEIKEYQIVGLEKNKFEVRKTKLDGSLEPSLVYSRSDSDGTENKNNQGNGGTDSDENEKTSDALYVELKDYQANAVYYAVGYSNSNDKNKDTDYAYAGVCYGTNPNPTISDACTAKEKVDGNTFHLLQNLVKDTFYYIRPYTTKDGVVTYYKQSTFSTQGAKTIYCNLSVIQGNTVEYEYGINKDGSYEVAIYSVDPVKNNRFVALDLGKGHKKGDNDKGNYTYPYDWESTRYLQIEVTNTQTKQRWLCKVYRN